MDPGFSVILGRDYAVFLLRLLDISNNVVYSFCQSSNNVCGGAVGWGIALLAGSSRVRFPRKFTARMLPTIPARIPNEWLLRPQFYLWPPQSQRAILWALTPFVTFRQNRQRGQTLHDLMDFLRRPNVRCISRRAGVGVSRISSQY